MGLSAQCAAATAQSGSCRVSTTALAAGAGPSDGAPASNRRYIVGFDYSDVTDTVYVFVDHYTTVARSAATADALARRLLDLNWEMLVGKFEWSPASGEVRLGAVLNTDSNFDRRAFRGVLRTVLRLADRYADDIARVGGAAVGDSTAPAAAAPTAAAAPGTR